MITELDRIKALESELAALKAQISARSAANEAKLWNPSGGDFLVCQDGGLISTGFPYQTQLTNNGYTYKTQSQAEQAAISIRKHNRLLAYVTEAIANSDNPNWVADWSNHNTFKYKIYVYSRNGSYKVDTNTVAQELNQVYMPENIARELVVKLNSGEVVL